MTCVRQPRKFKTRVYEDIEQYELTNASLVEGGNRGVGSPPEHAWSLVLFVPGCNIVCPHEEWQDSASDVHGDITMSIHNGVRTIGGIGNGTNTHEQTSQDNIVSGMALPPTTLLHYYTTITILTVFVNLVILLSGIVFPVRRCCYGGS